MRKLTSLLLIICLCGIISPLSAQDIRSRLKIEYLKQSDNTKVLTAKLLLREGRKYVPAPGQTVSYSVLNNEEEVTLGTALTDKNGEAILLISPGYQLPVNEDNYTTLLAAFAGNDSCRSSSSDIEVKALNVEMELGNKESKTITVMIKEKGEEGDMVAVTDEYLSVYIERLYSLLPIGDGVTDENGVFEFTYEDEIPGDEDGDVNVVVRLEESDLYGTVEAAQKVKWGTPVDYTVDVSARALWTDQAPLWMLIATFIVLVGAWFNFGLALINLFKVKKAGVKTETS